MPLTKNILSEDLQEVQKEISKLYKELISPDIDIQNNVALSVIVGDVADAVHTANINKSSSRGEEFFNNTALGRSMRDFAQKEGDYLSKAEKFAKSLVSHPFVPAFTAHPTNPKSPEADKLIVDIYDLIMAMRNVIAVDGVDPDRVAKKKTVALQKADIISKERNIDLRDEKDPEKLLTSLMTKFSQEPLQRENKLTVAEEVQRNLDIFKIVFKEFNKKKHQLLEQYYDVNDVKNDDQKAEIAKVLIPAIMKQFQETHFWSGSDADGNDKITAQTMLDAVKSHQIFLDELYKEEVDEVIKHFSNNAEVTQDLNSIKGLIGYVESLEGSGELVRREDNINIIDAIDQLMLKAENENNITLTPNDLVVLEDLKDSFDCFGFIGPKMDVRQSSFRNVTAMEQILDFLRSQNIADPTKFGWVNDFKDDYSKLSSQDQKRFCNQLEKSEDFVSLFNQGNLENKLKSLEKITNHARDKAKKRVEEAVEGSDAQKEAQIALQSANVAEQELGRMIAGKSYPETFHRYIISDNKGINSWHEVRGLEGVATMILGSESKSKESLLSIYPLCERRKDIDNLPKMVNSLLSDPESAAALNGNLNLFIGYSDSEKRAGIFALSLMQKRVYETYKIIEKYNEEHPDSKIEINIFHGQGNDFLRGGKKNFGRTTDQGQGAADLALKQRWKARFNEVAGVEDNFILQMKQWDELGEDLMRKAELITESSAQAFEDFVRHAEKGEAKDNGDYLAEFLQASTLAGPLSQTNKSSRKKDKGINPSEKVLNLDSERAIGLATTFSSSGIHSNVFKGMSINLDAYKQVLPDLFKNLTVMQDIVYKTLYSLAITDFSRAEKISVINGKDLNSEILKDLKDSSFAALKNIMSFLPMDEDMRKAKIANIQDMKSQGQSIQNVTMNVMADLQKDYSVVGELLSAAKGHHENYHTVIKPILDQYKSADSEGQKKLDSDLAVEFRQEMRVPRVIDELTTRTPILNSVLDVPSASPSNKTTENFVQSTTTQENGNNDNSYTV